MLIYSIVLNGIIRVRLLSTQKVCSHHYAVSIQCSRFSATKVSVPLADCFCGFHSLVYNYPIHSPEASYVLVYSTAQHLLLRIILHSVFLALFTFISLLTPDTSPLYLSSTFCLLFKSKLLKLRSTLLYLVERAITLWLFKFAKVYSTFPKHTW